jgi:hypothetical protein
MKEYIRFGEIPDDECSGIYNNEGELVGKERGVSYYECICFNNQYRILLPYKPTRYTCITLHNLYEQYFEGNINMYLITGFKVGYGSDNEPLLKNIQVLKKISRKSFKS